MFQISADFKMPSSPQARWDANVEAIATIKNAKHLTRQEKQALIKFSGSGSVKQVFDPETSLKWAQAGRDWMKENLTQEQFEAAYKTQTNAFYTSPVIASAMWEVLNGMGFHAGKILSLSAGTGIFTATHPDSHSSEWHLCEIDPTPATICRSAAGRRWWPSPPSPCSAKGCQNVRTLRACCRAHPRRPGTRLWRQSRRGLSPRLMRFLLLTLKICAAA
jgi:hypothetical protein